MSSGGRSLLARDSAADWLEFQANILSRFHSTAYGLAHERGDFDSPLFDVKNDSAAHRHGGGCRGEEGASRT